MTNHIVVAADAHAVQAASSTRVFAYFALAGATIGAGSTQAALETKTANWPALAGSVAVRPAGAAAFHRRAQSTSVIDGRYRGKSR